MGDQRSDKNKKPETGFRAVNISRVHQFSVQRSSIWSCDPHTRGREQMVYSIFKLNTQYSVSYHFLAVKRVLIQSNGSI